MLNIKNIVKPGDMSLYREHRGAAHSICNLKYSAHKGISIVLDNRFNSRFNWLSLSLRLEGEETLKYHCVCQPPSGTEKFNIVRNKYGRTHKCYLSVFDRKHPFWANLVQKVKIVSLSWNLVPRLIRICRIQWCCSVFLF